MQALKELCVDVKVYFSSEINKQARKVCKYHHPRVVHLGNVWRLNTKFVRYVIVRVHLSVSSLLRVCGVLMLKILNKCILSLLVYNLFLDRQRNILHTPKYFQYIPGILAVLFLLHSNFQKNGRKNRSDTKNQLLPDRHELLLK